MKNLLICCLILGATLRMAAQCSADKAPPILKPKGNILVALGGPKCLATVKPADLLQSVHDNCTPDQLLTLRIRKAGANPDFPNAVAGAQLQLSVGDVGKPIIGEVWAKDTSGNAAFVYTSITVSNPDGCDFTLLPDTVCVQAPNGAGLEDVVFSIEVVAPPAPGLFEFTSGCFDLPADLLAGDSAQYVYQLSPGKDDNPLNGVSTFDGLLIFNHIIGTSRFDSPYKWIAADINRDGQVTLNDIGEMRKLILGIYTNGLPLNTSWRFVPADFDFPQTDNPIASTFPESVLVNNQRTTPLPDFIPIKVGDINGNAVSNSALAAEDRAPLTLRIRDIQLPAGETIAVPVYLSDSLGLAGFQFDLSYDEKVFDLAGLHSDVLSGFSADNYHLQYPGYLAVSYIPSQPNSIRPELPLFYLELKARDATALHYAHLAIHPYRIHPEVYDNSGRVAVLNLQIDPLPLPAQTVIDAVTLNPSRRDMNLRLNLAKAGPVTIYLFRIDGQELYSETTWMNPGPQELNLPASIWRGESGVFIYRVVAGSVSREGKMVVTR